MAVEVLVMCGRCGRSQHAGREACVVCGATLPEAEAAPPPEQGAPAGADPPFMEADLGRGRALALSRKRLEWRQGRGERPVLIELARLASVRLDRRPVFESLIFAVPALAALPLAASPLLRTALVALLLWAVAACFAQRRYVLRLQNDRGEQAGLLLGMGRPRAPRGGMRIESVWSSLAQELRALGVKVLPALLVLLASGCGYRFTAGGAPLPGGIRSVCAPVFTNQTAEPGLELLFTQALRERLIRAGVQGGGACEAQLQGELLSLRGGPTIVTPGQVLVSYRLHATASLRLTKAGQVVSEAQVAASEDYLPAGALGDVLQMEANRQAAIRRLVKALARDGYERLAGGW